MYRLLLLDIDGTLRPKSCPVVPEENVLAVQALQRHGVQIAIATGRSRRAVPADVLGGIVPDYWILSAGAQVLDAGNHVIFGRTMSAFSVDCIHSFCKEYDFPLILNYDEGNYIHIGYNIYKAAENMPSGMKTAVYDPDDSRREAGQPYSCFVWMPGEMEAEFHRRYPDSGLCFYFYRGRFCDVMTSGVTKAYGLDRLLELTDLRREETVFLGDGENDVDLLRAAGLSYCMADGQPAALAAAQRIAPPSDRCGVAAVCRELWPEAFSADGTPSESSR